MEDGCYEVVGYEGTIEHLVVPAGNEKFRITKISAGAFWDCNTITSIEVAEGIKVIEKNAFPYDTQLTYISLPCSLEYCGIDLHSICPNEIMHEYEGCYYIGNESNNYLILVSPVSRDEHTYSINSETKIIGPNSFSQINTLEMILIPSNIVSIEWYAFLYCENLTQIIFENNSCLKKIGFQSFDNCISLKSIDITNTVEIIEEGAFNSCANLIEIKFKENSVLKEIHQNAFRECRNLIYINIPASVISIGSHAFYYCDKIKNVYFEKDSKLETIGAAAFADCFDLISIQIPSYVIDIGKGAFNDCLSLESISIPFVGNTIDGKMNTHFGYIFGAPSSSDNFKYVPTSLKEVYITGGSMIDVRAFAGCKYISRVKISSTVEIIKSCAFIDCENLIIFCESSIQPSGWESGWNYNNRPVYWGIDDDVIFEDEDFEYLIDLKNNYATIIKFKSEKESIEIADKIIIEQSIYQVKNIGEQVFKNSDKLCRVVIPNGIISIGNLAFLGCINLTNIIIPNSVTKIGYGTFSDCKSLEKIFIPKSVINIGSGAFENCDKLIIYCEVEEKPSGWNNNWNISDRPIIWKHNKELN